MLLLQLLLSVTCSAYVVIRDHSLASHRVKHTVLTGGGVDRVRGDGITTGLPQFRVMGSASHISLLDPQPLVASRTLGPLLAATLPTSSSSSASPPSASTLESMGGCITTEVETDPQLCKNTWIEPFVYKESTFWGVETRIGDRRRANWRPIKMKNWKIKTFTPRKWVFGAKRLFLPRPFEHYTIYVAQ